MRDNPGAQYEISVDGVPRTHCDRQDIALQTARFLNPNSMVKMKDLRTGEETPVAFKPGEERGQRCVCRSSALVRLSHSVAQTRIPTRVALGQQIVQGRGVDRGGCRRRSHHKVIACDGD
jgi:hypothetical protein